MTYEVLIDLALATFEILHQAAPLFTRSVPAPPAFSSSLNCQTFSCHSVFVLAVPFV